MTVATIANTKNIINKIKIVIWQQHKQKLFFFLPPITPVRPENRVNNPAANNTDDKAVPQDHGVYSQILLLVPLASSTIPAIVTANPNSKMMIEKNVKTNFKHF